MKNQKGQSLIEILIVIGLSAILLPALLTGLVASREGKAQDSQRSQALTLLTTTIEAARSVRENGWASFAINGTFHPEISGSSWTLVGGSDTINGFTRKIEISDVNRDSNGTIVTTGGTLDPSTKKIVATISWGLPYISLISDTLYMTRYLDNNGHIDTTTSDFTIGATHTSTVTQDPPSADGEVILGAGGGGGNWCTPSASIVAQDLPKSGVANAITAIEGSDGNVIVFAGTGDNSSGVSFADVDIVGDTPSISTSIPATFDGYKTNAVFGENDYSYLATDNNSKEIVIMSLTQFSNPPTNSKYLEVGSINLPGNVNGNSIFVVNNKAYVLSSNNKFYIYNLSADRTSATLQNTGGLTISGSGKKVLVAEDYAYVATGATSNQFQIINVESSSSPNIAGQITLGSSQTGVDIYVNTNIEEPSVAYFVTSYSAGNSNVFKINISNESSPVVEGSGYSTNGMNPTGITVVTGNKGIVVGSGGTEQYQVFDVGTFVKCAGLVYSTGINGVSSVLKTSGYAYSYIITGDASAELKIILGGGGSGTTYAPAGSFISDAVDALIPTVFNRFEFTVTQPLQTTIGFQVAVANPAPDCASATYEFIGPGLTSNISDVFTTGSPVPILSSGSYQNPGQCFKYKVYFTTVDSNQTPVLYDFTLNYSP
ncbi:MAG: prepilin-type N-terminal cleavage/methylation domain-containing protein [Candidatus Levybacteria bacterium]|nr:prepilin-type N-terminal cleavage/methylation domain-containing protein [Candidatus Levybacteria bacterium]